MRDRLHAAAAAALLAAIALLPEAALAQVRASELGSISQMIDGTKFTVEYSRPRLRGRATVFGTEWVPWGETWTGANFATTFDVNRDVTLNGRRVPKGKYSVWFVVRQAGDWTAILDPRWHLYHEQKPDSNATQIRFPVHVEDAPNTDVLTWTVPELRVSGGTLAMQWSTKRATIDIEVQPSYSVTMSADSARPYLGTYDWVPRHPRPGMPTFTFTVSYEDSTLKGQWTPNRPYFNKFALVRIAPGWFAPGIYDEHGKVYEVMRPELTFEFTRAGQGPASSFLIRNAGDSVNAEGHRIDGTPRTSARQ